MSAATEAPLDQRIGRRIRMRLRVRRWSQAHLAERLGVSSAWLSNRISGRYSFTVSELTRIAGELELTYEALAVPVLPAEQHETPAGMR